MSQDVRELDLDGRVYATAMDDIGWAAIGRYPEQGKMGGCDLMKSVEEIKAAINWTMNARPHYWIVFEGMMISTIKSTFYDYLLGLRAIDRHVMPLFVILKTTPEACYERILGRGTMKQGLNMDNVSSKLEGILRHAQTYDQRYVRYLNVDTLRIDGMLPWFLWTVGDMELLKVLS